MKAKQFAISVVLVLLGALLVSCGPSNLNQPLIQKDAADLNFTAEELGSNFVVLDEASKDQILKRMELTEEEIAVIEDANLRALGSEETQVMVTSLIFRLKDANSAVASLDKNWDTITRRFKEQFPNKELSELTPPKLGDKVMVVKASFPEEGFNIYVAGIRKVNVVGIMSFIGSEESLPEQTVMDYLRKLESHLK